jgi:hypothetical protein
MMGYIGLLYKEVEKAGNALFCVAPTSVRIFKQI